MFSVQFCKTFKNTFFTEHLQVTASACSFWEPPFIRVLRIICCFLEKRFQIVCISSSFWASTVSQKTDVFLQKCIVWLMRCTSWVVKNNFPSPVEATKLFSAYIFFKKLINRTLKILIIFAKNRPLEHQNSWSNLLRLKVPFLNNIDGKWRSWNLSKVKSLYRINSENMSFTNW